MIYCIIYFIIGLYLAWHWWYIYYEEEYEKAASEGELEKGMASIFLMFLTFMWPIKALCIIYDAIKKTK